MSISTLALSEKRKLFQIIQLYNLNVARGLNAAWQEKFLDVSVNIIHYLAMVRSAVTVCLLTLILGITRYLVSAIYELT